MFWQLLFGGVSLIPFIKNYPSAVTMPEIGLLLAVGIFATALAHTMLASSLHWLSARTVSLIASIQPVYGVILGILLFDEIPSLRILIGGMIISSIVIIETRDQKKAT